MIIIKSNEISNLYDSNVAILKDYGGIKYKLIHFNVLRKKGFEIDIQKSYRCTVNDEKLENNISRARSKIFEYSMCNDFEYFVTLTIDSKKYDRTNLKSYYKDFAQWLRNQSKKYNSKISYIFIPELHKDRNTWHMHGLISGIPLIELNLFAEGDNVPIDLITQGYYNWNAYNLKFGFVSMAKIKNREACSKYITKYINKNLSADIQELNSKLYYCSKGLKTSTEIKKGTIFGDIVPDFKNDYLSIKWFNNQSEAENLIFD